MSYCIHSAQRTGSVPAPSGARIAVLPLEDYESLVEAAEDAADVRAYDEIKAKIVSGEREFIPAEFVNRMIDGENKIKVWRDFRGMAARALAEAAGISAPYLSQIESGARDGSSDAMKKIGEALKGRD